MMTWIVVGLAAAGIALLPLREALFRVGIGATWLAIPGLLLWAAGLPQLLVLAAMFAPLLATYAWPDEARHVYSIAREKAAELRYRTVCWRSDRSDSHAAMRNVIYDRLSDARPGLLTQVITDDGMWYSGPPPVELRKDAPYEYGRLRRVWYSEVATSLVCRIVEGVASGGQFLIAGLLLLTTFPALVAVAAEHQLNASNAAIELVKIVPVAAVGCQSIVFSYLTLFSPKRSAMLISEGVMTRSAVRRARKGAIVVIPFLIASASLPLVAFLAVSGSGYGSALSIAACGPIWSCIPAAISRT